MFNDLSKHFFIFLRSEGVHLTYVITFFHRSRKRKSYLRIPSSLFSSYFSFFFFLSLTMIFQTFFQRKQGYVVKNNSPKFASPILPRDLVINKKKKSFLVRIMFDCPNMGRHTLQGCLTPQNVRKQHISISVSYNIYHLEHRKWSF